MNQPKNVRMIIMQRIYLDQAATSFPKAPGTADAVFRFMTECGCNVGRGSYAGAYSAEELVYPGLGWALINDWLPYKRKIGAFWSFFSFEK